jgi:thiamine kinase
VTSAGLALPRSAAPDGAVPDGAALARVPGLERGAAPLRLERLAGGSVNECWRVDTEQGRFVLRLDGPVTLRPGVDRAREERLHAVAAAAGLAPRLCVSAAAAGVQVREYLDGRSWSEADLADPVQLERLGRRLAQVHELRPPEGIAGFDPGASAREYLRLLPPGTDRQGAAAAAALVGTIEAAARVVADGACAPGIVHGDLAHANLLEGARLWLLDWEYAQLADPIYDIACVLAYYPLARPQASRLLAAAGLAGPGRARRLEAAVRIYRGLSQLWHLARGEPASVNRPEGG